MKVNVLISDHRNRSYLIMLLPLLISIGSQAILSDPMTAGVNVQFTSVNDKSATQATDRIKLIEPDSASQVSSTFPSFRWRAISRNRQVNYRLLIAKTDGKIVLDRWVGSDTSFTITEPNLIEDLKLYNWLIYAIIDDRQIQSPVWSFWVDQNKVTDLNISHLDLISPRAQYRPGDEIVVRATIHNSGPVAAKGAYVLLYSGNPNNNYFHYAAFRKTVLLDTIFIAPLQVGVSRELTLSANLPAGYNRLFVRVEPAPGFRDVIIPNNFTTGIAIQTDPRRLILKALFIVYSQYLAPNEGPKVFSSKEQQEILHAINNFQEYIWNSTYALQIQSDTLCMARPLTIRDFIKKDDAWGYYLSPRPVETDLSNRHIRPQDYDLLVVIYCWWNSQSTWSGYSGYTFRDTRSLKQKPAIIAQPIVPGYPLDETILIHEFLHYLDNRYEELGEPRFYSPHHRILYTTFDRDEDYYRWILETWPTEWWFKLDVGQIVISSNQATILPKMQSPGDPNSPKLLQNYPNPFNQMTTISFSVPANNSSEGPITVRLVVYDRLGKLATILVDQMLAPGTYDVSWDGRDLDGHLLASGIYFYQLILPTQRQAKKMLLLR